VAASTCLINATTRASGFGSEFSTLYRQVPDGIHAFPLTDLWTATTSTFQSAHLFYAGLSLVLGQRYPTGLELGVIGL